MAATSEKAKRQIKRGEHGKLVKGTAPLDRKGHERGPDHGPRVTASLKTAMRQFLDEEGHLVPGALRRALENLYDLKAGVAAAKVLLDYGLKVDGPGRAGKGLVIVLSSMKDPLADRSRPTPFIDLTMSGLTGPPDESPPPGRGPATAAKAPPPEPAASIATALPAPKKTTPERIAKIVANAERLDAKYWRGDCPACRGRGELTWSVDAEGRAADFVCGRDCGQPAIIAGLKARNKALREAAATHAAAPARVPPALQSDGEDMVCTSDDEPKILLPVPTDD